MKKLIASFLLLVASVSFAVPAPFAPWSEKLISEKVIDLPSANVLVGNSLGKAEAMALSGDVAISNAGVASISAGVVTEADMLAQTADGLNVKRIARATYDFAEHTGVIGAYSLGVALPAKAIITQSWFYMNTQPVDAGSGTMAIHCEDANNIFSAADITGITVGTVTAGVSIGTAATMTKAIGAACNITATIAGADLTAGKFTVFVEYVVHD